MSAEHATDVPCTDGLRIPVQRDPCSTGPSHSPAEALLVGGPPDLPDGLRERRGPVEEPKVKIEHRGGYEHFERDDRTVGHRPVIFRWTTRTRIAE